jgi:hypothetical protein
MLKVDIALLGSGIVVAAAGLAGVALADTDTTCYMTANTNVGGNWIGGSQACNTSDCPEGMGGKGACQVRLYGASSLHPGYDVYACMCAPPPTSGVRCELVWYVNHSDSNDYFAGCPLDVCDSGQTCIMDPPAGTAGSHRCLCQ